MNNINLLLVIIIGALQIGDVVTTEKILNNGGKELNPIMNWFFTHFGFHNVLVTKAVLVVAISVLLSKFSPIALIFVSVIYVGVVGWNIYQLNK